MILHIAERARWAAASASSSGAYTPAVFGAEGFVHCSEPRQVEAVAKRLFRGREDLVVLAIDENRLSAQVRREKLESGDELFPHVYGPIELEAVLAVHRLVPDAAGRLELAEWLQELGA